MRMALGLTVLELCGAVRSALFGLPKPNFSHSRVTPFHAFAFLSRNSTRSQAPVLVGFVPAAGVVVISPSNGHCVQVVNPALVKGGIQFAVGTALVSAVAKASRAAGGVVFGFICMLSGSPRIEGR